MNECIAGMDEAGRGAWAGPVCAAAVVLPKGTRLPGLTDSKLLTPAKREVLFEKIIQKCSFGVGLSTHEEVDAWGLSKATFVAYERALEQLNAEPDHLLIDGRDPFEFHIPSTKIIKGDLKVRCISAASILAKVTRDRWMVDQSSQFPDYAFELHKGYGTKAHQQALKQNGPCTIHRMSYAPIRALSQQNLGL